jgi:hypothetical protein
VKAESIEERIANHLRPPERPDFFDELWERAEADARRSAKRWRAAAIALAALAVAAVSAAAVVAARSGGGDGATGLKTVDRTIVCGQRTDLGSGLRVFASIDQPKAPAGVGVTPASGVRLSGIGVFAVASRQWYDVQPNGKIGSMKGGYGFDDTVCQRTSRIPLAASGLPRLGVFSRATWPNRLSFFCPNASAPMLVRMRVTVINGIPKAAQLAVRVGAHTRPVAFIDWTPKRFTAYGSNGCLRD